MNSDCIFVQSLGKCSLVTLAKVTKLRKRHSVVSAEVIECYKGNLAQGAIFDVRVAQGLGIEKGTWFAKHETCLILAFGTPLVSLGYLGRMPLLNIEDELCVRAYVSSPDFFAPLPNLGSDGMVAVRWHDVRRDLISRQSHQR